MNLLFLFKKKKQELKKIKFLFSYYCSDNLNIFKTYNAFQYNESLFSNYRI